MAELAVFYDHILEMAEQKGISPKEALQEAGRLGITAVEVSAANAQGRGRELARLLGGAGMTVSAMPMFFDFGSGQDVDRQIGSALDLARELGAGRILVIPGFVKGEPEERARQTGAMIAAVSKLGERAAQAGTGLVMEDFDNAAAPFSTSRQMLRFMDACPELSACFDTGNFRFAGEDELQAYEALRGKIGHVHLKDRAYEPVYGAEGPAAADGKVLYPCPVGRGEIPISRIMERLQADGYDGVYTIEHYGAEDQLECLKQSAAWVRKRLGLGMGDM